MDAQQEYVKHLDVINRISESLCRRNGVRGADAEDFAADVRLRLLQDDYAVLRKYRGASSLTTFLTVVISNLFRDHRIKRLGRWRPSAKATQLGDTAQRLEALLYRDHLSFEQACNRLAQDGHRPIDRAELRKLYRQLPLRVHRHDDDVPDIDDVPAPDSTDGPLIDGEREERIKAAKTALTQAIGRLAPDDQLLVRLHFFEGMSVAEVARGTGVRQKPLYTRLTRLLAVLHQDLARQGIGQEYREWMDSEPT